MLFLTDYLSGALLTITDCNATFAGDYCLDASVYPSPEGQFFGMSALYWEFSYALGFTENPGMEVVSGLVEEKCKNPTECDTCSGTDCYEVRYDFLKLMIAPYS